MRIAKADKLKVLEGYYTHNFEKLCKKRSGWVGGLGNAEDCVQEGFTRALKYIEGWTGPQPFSHWVNTIINNACRDFKKADRLQGGNRDTVDADEEAGEPLEQVQLTEEMAKIIMEEIADKPAPKQTAIRDYLILGYTCKEIAEYVDMSQANIRKVVQRFREEMENKYGKDVCSGPRS
jgi:RNA polymerase sigma factor (sigma-70 family)